MDYISHSEKQTKKIAKTFAKHLKIGDIVLLYGDLGAGKTVFASGVAKFFSRKCATSPTFTLLNIYKGKITLFHFDMYRLKDENELDNIGIEDYFYGDGVCLIEWPERIINRLPKNFIKVNIEKIDDYSRKITIEGVLL